MLTSISQFRSDKHAAHGEDTQVLPDTGGDTDPATDTEEPAVAGMKRTAARPAGSTQKYVLTFLCSISMLIAPLG